MSKYITAALCLVLVTSIRAQDDILIADFEADDYGQWQVTGEAFGAGPARGTLPNQMPVDGFEGQRLVNSYHGGDAPTGTLTSPEFEINRDYLRFLIGGGGIDGKTCMNLVVEGRTVRTATGSNTQAGGSERLELAGWDVSDLRGSRAQLVIVDQASGGWGHINVDQISLSDNKPPLILIRARHELVAKEAFLNFPVKNGGPRRVVTVSSGDRMLHRFDIELADAEPDWWAPLDIAGLRDQTLIIEVDRLSEQSQALQNIRQSNELLGAQDLYSEPLRPLLHFSPKRGWNNDPNGLVFYDDEYHLFFQHNPYGTSWGNMHWGHAVSRDLVHWEELGEALYPDEQGTMFSGSAVIDWHNTSGLQSGDEPPMILLYTAAGEPFVQCLAYSNDRGRTFTKYEHNPILKNITPGNRDPKVIWYEPTGTWVMVLYVEVDKKHTIQFFTSPNLKDWKFESQTDGFFECPDFFPLAIDGDASKTKWVLTGASSEYMVGTFDGRQFHPETEKLPGHRGNGFYAAQTFSDIPDRRIQIGWGQMPSPGMPFNQMMCLPCELTLRSTDAGPRMAWQPVRELVEHFESSRAELVERELTEDQGLQRELGSRVLEVQLEFKIADAKELKIVIWGIEIVCDVQNKELRCLGKSAPVRLDDNHLRLRAIFDLTSLELFADDGLVYMPLAVINNSDQAYMSVKAIGGSAKSAAAIRNLHSRSIWAKR